MKFKNFLEKVSPNCDTGSGVIPDGPYKGWKVYRTSHLDDIRKPSNKERDDGFSCATFEVLVKKFLQKRALGINSGKYQLTWKNSRGYQAVVVNVTNDNKTISFITVMQLNKKAARDYYAKGPSIDLGLIKEPA